MTRKPMESKKPMADPDRCTATARSTGERCKQPAIRGGNVCRFHGGASGHVKKKAQERLDEMADKTTADMQRVLDDLTDIYEHADADEKVEIAREIRQSWVKILDRTGHGPTEKREIAGSDGGPLEFTIQREVVDGNDN